MALYTVSTGGVIAAADLNQYYNLFTGTTTDQQVTVANRVRAQLTGATTASGYVGGTASGAPSSGTFAVGDMVITQNGPIYVCTTAGTPGTWQATPSQISTTTTGSVASLTLSSIPAFANLRLTWHTRSDTAATTTTVLMRVNGDTGNNYERQYIEANSTVVSAGQQGSQSSIILASIPAASATTNYWGGGSATVTGWNNPGGFPVVVAHAAGFVTTSSSLNGIYTGQYNSATTYTSITLLPSAGNFVSGSVFSLYGMP